MEKRFTVERGSKDYTLMQFHGKSKSCFPHATFPTIRRCHPSIYPADSGYVPKTVEIRVNVQPRCSMETNGDFGCHFCLWSHVLEQWPKFHRSLWNYESFVVTRNLKHCIHSEYDYKCFWLRTLIDREIINYLLIKFIILHKNTSIRFLNLIS